jgi:putative glycerol-1-phosphate prenyltransferase
MHECIKAVKENCSIPVVIFPGHAMQIDSQADAILFLSLISGRNPELLIGQHVIGAPVIKEKQLPVIPTGYILVDGGSTTTAIYMSGTAPIPNNKPDIAACTALAGEMLGLKLIFLDAGSGASNSIPTNMIAAVRNQINVPLMVGGGIRDAQTAKDKCLAGADIVVVGNAIESNPSLISELSDAVHSV